MTEPMSALEDPPKKSAAFKWLIGCSIALVVVGVLCAGGAWYAFSHLADFVWEATIEGTVAMLEEVGLPEEDVASIQSDLERLRAAYEDGRVDLQSLGEFASTTMQGPFLQVVLLRAFGNEYLPRAELDPEALARAERDLQRLERGVWEGVVSTHRVQTLLGTSDGNANEWEERWAEPAEIRATLDEVSAIVNEKAIADEPFELDMIAEFRQLIDDVIEGS